MPGIPMVVRLVPLVVFVILAPLVPKLYPMPDLLRLTLNPPPRLMLFLNLKPMLLSSFIAEIGRITHIIMLQWLLFVNGNRN